MSETKLDARICPQDGKVCWGPCNVAYCQQLVDNSAPPPEPQAGSDTPWRVVEMQHHGKGIGVWGVAFEPQTFYWMAGMPKELAERIVAAVNAEADSEKKLDEQVHLGFELECSLMKIFDAMKVNSVKDALMGINGLQERVRFTESFETLQSRLREVEQERNRLAIQKATVGDHGVFCALCRADADSPEQLEHWKGCPVASSGKA